jgi:hypothetical protein
MKTTIKKGVGINAKMILHQFVKKPRSEFKIYFCFDSEMCVCESNKEELQFIVSTFEYAE